MSSRSLLDQLKEMSGVVVDSADFTQLGKYGLSGATTNPSLILQSLQNPVHISILDEAIDYARKKEVTEGAQIEATLNKLTISFGLRVLEKTSGRVSVEVDAKHSFSTPSSLNKARHLVDMFEEVGIPRSRIYIKLASTWEGIEAARVLEKEGIACNMTLLFSFAQAMACAAAQVSLISPFVGRILDWHKKNDHNITFLAQEDPGVKRATEIYRFFKANNCSTIIMAASFRNVDEIKALSGCDFLTISPTLLQILEHTHTPLRRVLSAETNKSTRGPKLEPLTREAFLFMHNEDAMAVEKLAEGIRLFNRDARKVEEMIRQRMQNYEK